MANTTKIIRDLKTEFDMYQYGVTVGVNDIWFVDSVNGNADQTINTEVIGKPWASLASNDITLDAGEYLIYVQDFGTATQTGNTVYSEITIAGGANLDVRQWSQTGNPTEFYLTWTSAIKLASSTTIRYRTEEEGSGTLDRLAKNMGAEHYQKLIIQKIG